MRLFVVCVCIACCVAITISFVFHDKIACFRAPKDVPYEPGTILCPGQIGHSPYGTVERLQ